jgi:hypothetical protein
MLWHIDGLTALKLVLPKYPVDWIKQSAQDRVQWKDLVNDDEPVMGILTMWGTVNFHDEKTLLQTESY